MAAGRIVLPAYMPALDSDGEPISGAQIYTYFNNTTTPRTTYTDASLTVPHENPVVADSGGVFPSIFADAAVQYSVTVTDASDAPLAAYDTVKASAVLATDEAALKTANLSDLSDTDAARSALRVRSEWSGKSAYRKRIFAQLPYRTADIDAAIASYSYSFVYPQAFCIDFDANEIWITKDPSGGSNNWQWVEVWDAATLTLKRTFSYGGALSQAIVVLYEGADRFFYAISASGKIGKYDVTTLPTSMAYVTPAVEYTVDVSNKFTYRDGVWSVEQLSTPLGTNVQRNIFVRYNADFSQRLGSFRFELEDVGPVSGDLIDYFSKQQGISQGNGFYVGSIGGLFTVGDTVEAYHAQGLRVYDHMGRKVADGALDPEGMIDILDANGVDCTRVESEGAYASADDRIFTLSVVKAGASYDDGLVIFEEFSDAEDAIDFSAAATTTPSLDRAYLEAGIFPKAGAAMYHPVTGAQLTTWDHIVKMMISLDLRTFSYYSGSITGSTDINGVAVPSSVRVTFWNLNNSTVHVEVSSGTYWKRYNITSASAVTPTQTLITPYKDTDGWHMDGSVIGNITSLKQNVTSASGAALTTHVQHGRNESALTLLYCESATNAAAHTLALAKSEPSGAAVESGTVLGNYSFHGSDGTNLLMGALIRSTTRADAMTGNLKADLSFYTRSGSSNAGERFRIQEDGVFFYVNALSAPSGSPSGGGYLYAEGGALKWKGSSGTVTTIAPA